jgi:hypothetical protein
MILGEPTLETILDLISEEGCPLCGDDPGAILVNGPSEITLNGCGHTIDAEPYIDSS